ERRARIGIGAHEPGISRTNREEADPVDHLASAEIRLVRYALRALVESGSSGRSAKWKGRTTRNAPPIMFPIQTGMMFHAKAVH
ncbi:MAG: hypothetical protein WCJ21_08860, partial [Planctomycetota bacterium]